MQKNTNHLFNALKGAAMGIAEVIPGVSGGTIAFITGIYEQLLNSIKAFSPALITTMKQEGLKGIWQSINGNFLLSLLSGMVMGFMVGLFGISYMLENYPVVVWAFFFGLILASVIYIGKQISRWRIIEIAALVLGAILVYFITTIAPSGGSNALWYVFICGAIAISALMLPGLSGSFMLLILGMYQFVLHDTFKEGILENFDPQAMIVFVVFALGCLIGLVTFSRILSWTFKKYRNPTLALMLGFMLGSLNKIWPWKKAIEGLDEHGNLVEASPGIILDKIIKEANLLPNQYTLEVGDPYTIAAISAAFIGFFLVFILEKIGSKK